MNASPRRRIFQVALATVSGSLLICAWALGRPEGPAAGDQGSSPRYPRHNTVTGYAVDPSWPDHAGLPEWGEMSGIAVDPADAVWTFNRGSLPVQVFDVAGKAVRSWGAGVIDKAHHIRLDPGGNVWVTDIGLHVVRKLGAGGELLLTLGTPGVAGEDSSHFNMPTDVAVTPAGDIFVADGYGNNRIVHFGPEADYVKAWGRMGSEPGEFSLPHSIAVDSRGFLYVADRNNVRIQVFDQEGRFLQQWGELLVPWHIWITPDDAIYACGSSPMRWPSKLPIPGMMLGVPPKDQILLKLDSEGRVLRLWSFAMGQERAGEVDWLHALALDSKGNLYAGDIQGRRAQKFLLLQADADPLSGVVVDESKVDPAVRPAANPR